MLEGHIYVMLMNIHLPSKFHFFLREQMVTLRGINSITFTAHARMNFPFLGEKLALLRE